MKTIQLVPSTQEVVTGQTWIGGPTYELQKQHVPGYAGHVRGLKAVNFRIPIWETVRQGLGRVLGATLAQMHELRGKGSPLNTQYAQLPIFEQPNLRKPQFQTAAERLLEQAKFEEREINETNKRTYQAKPKSIQDIPPIDRVPVVGYQGFRAVYRHPLKTVVPPEPPKEFVHPLNSLEPQMARTMLETDEKFRKTFEEPRLPVVGYTGFMTGIKAENMYGQPYKDISSQVRNNQRNR